MELTVYKASAGSGKTFTLAVEYIRRLVANPTAYRNIMAVTFTNKATTEMKERILQQLVGLSMADPASDAYMESLKTALSAAGHSMDDDGIRRRCGEALEYMLHDYSRFRVTTIDSFFQLVTRGVARELGVGSNMNIELDAASVVQDAVKQMMDNLKPGSDTMRWVLQYVYDQIDNGRSHRIERNLCSFGQRIFDETFIEGGDKLRQQLRDTDFMQGYVHSLWAASAEALDSLPVYYKTFHQVLDEHHIDITELNRKGKDIESYFSKLLFGNDLDKPGTTIDKITACAENWTTKTSKRRNEIMSLAESTLMPLAKEAEAARHWAQRIVGSVNMTKRFLYQLQLLNAIAEEVARQNRLHNRFLLPDTNRLLSELIAEDDASFIYEKIGASITNVMIDEFQDTSRMQWRNLWPLLKEGLAQGADSLIVGDVKQSIYRWRGGDWNILNDMQAQQSPFRIDVRTLDTNRRSAANVIDFNNAVFGNAVDYYNSMSRWDTGDDCAPLSRAYADVAQKSTKARNEGHVKVTFVDDDNYDANMIKALGSEVTRLLEAGVPMNRIALLLRRTGNRLTMIADYFNKVLQIPVVSDEAFRLDASTAVGILVNALRVLTKPADRIAVAALVADYSTLADTATDASADYAGLFCGDADALLPPAFVQERSRLSLMPLYELLEELYGMFGLQRLHSQDAYLFKFFDEVGKYLADNASDINSFIAYWDDTLHEVTIPSGEIDGVRILTIHKSKGLEYHTVIVPYCDWSQTTDRTDTLVWCHSDKKPFSALDMMPIAYSNKMMDSTYSNDFLAERTQLWVDSLNLLYVAFTRAGKNLIVLGQRKVPRENAKRVQEEKRGTTISDMLLDIMPKVTAATDGTWDSQTYTYIKGELTPYATASGTQVTSDDKTVNVMSVRAEEQTVTMNSARPDVEFRESNRSADFIAGISEEQSRHRFMDRGNIMHQLFSIINGVDDIDRAVDSLVAEGIIADTDDVADIRQETHRAFENSMVHSWYDGSWSLFSECNIIWMEDGNLIQRRPDRVMMRGGDVVIVDFKFGKPNKKYNRQVHEYMELMNRMGYDSHRVSGYLWYVDNMIIEKV